MSRFICDGSFIGGGLIFIIFIILMLSAFYYLKDSKAHKKNLEKLKVARVVYSANLFDELKLMKKSGVFRLYSLKVSDELYVITTTMMGEEYKNGKLVSYYNKEAIEEETIRELLCEFVAKIDRLELKSFAYHKVGKKVRIGE